MLTLGVLYFLLYGLAPSVSGSSTTSSCDGFTSQIPVSDPTDSTSPPRTLKEVVLASFYTIHQAGIIPCDTIIPENIILSIIHEHSIQTANDKILSKLGIKLVSAFADTCDNASVALQKAVGIIGQSQGFCERKSDHSSHKSGDQRLSTKINEDETSQFLIAATGVFRGEIGDSINYLLRAFCLPVIASASSSAEMDNEINYPYFLRTGASDIYKAQVIFDILQSQQWYHILVISDSSSTGVALTNQFKTLIEYCDANDDLHLFRPPCVEYYFQLSFFDDSNEGELETERRNLAAGLNNSATRVIVMLMEDRAIDKTLLFLDTLDSNPGRWQFILSSSNIQSNTLLEYAFAVEENVEAYLEFYEVINNITLTNYENPWVHELIENENLCCWKEILSCPYSIQCTGDEKIVNVPEKASHEAIHVYNAIMLLATAIKNIHDQYCDVAGICPNLYNEATGRTLLSYLLNASFVDEFHQTFELFNRSATPVYNVSQMQDGTWTTVLFKYNPYIGPVPSLFNHPIKEIPSYNAILEESRSCQPNCDKTIIDMRGRCCWNCRACNPGEFINRTLLMCQNCSIDEMPNENLTGCILEPTPPLFYEPTAEMYVLMGVAVIGILLTIILTSYIYRFRKTPMVMASTPDLCYIQSVAQILLFIISSIMIPSPNMIVCGTVWTISSMLLVVTHAIFLIKAIRLSRPRFYTKLIAYANTPIKCSLIMLFIFFVSQLLICVIWILLRPPKPLRQFHEDIVHCSSNNEVQTIVLMILPLTLIIATFYFQRNAIRNKIMFQVRQARIGLAGTLCFLVNYSILLPLIYMEGSPAYVRATILMCIPFLTALVATATMHLPISYELFFRKKQNSHEYVSRERSRQFQAGNFVYYVDAMLLRRANRTRTQTTVNSNL